jgi:lipopolysaccharide/colanic/teichoic acid biosynthesis glycosyltransferase
MVLDLRYVDRWSLGLDVWILVKTIPTVLFQRGAR